MNQAGAAVFISYARVDRARVAKLAAALAGRGLTVWWDDHLEGGAAFARTIETELARCDAVVVVWSAAGVASDWVRDEAAVGRDRGILVPISFDATPPPLGFRQYHSLPFADWRGGDDTTVDAVARAVAVVAAAAGRGAAPAVAAIAVSPPVRTRRMAMVALACAAVVTLAVGGWRLTRSDSAPAAGHLASRAASVPSTSIAVLPFANLSGQTRDDYLSEGLAEQLRSTLASFSQVQVAARTSSLAFKGSALDARAIAAKLGVANVLEGSVQRDGATVRVGAHLVEAATGFERWSQRFDRSAGDTFAIQDEISRDVANALKVRLLLPPTVHGRGGTDDATALDAYLRGRQQYDQSGDEATYRAALGFFDAAIAADPKFAAAYAARARTLLTIGNQYLDGGGLRAASDAAVVAAKRAVALAPALADVQSTLGFVLYNRLDFAGAAAAYDRAYRASAGDADLLIRYAGFKSRMGDAAAATAALDRAAALDPLNPRVPRGQALVALAARRYYDAVAAIDRALALNPRMNGAHAIAGDARLLLGDAAGARIAYALEPQEMVRLTGLAMAEHALKKPDAAKEALAALVAKGGDNSLYQQAQVRAQWGDIDGAMAVLAKARAANDTGLVQLHSDPLLDPLRRDSRFVALQAALRFV